MIVNPQIVYRFIKIGAVVAAVATGVGTAWASGVDLKWMMAVEADIPAEIQMNRMYEDRGQIVVTGTAPRYVEIADFMRKIGADGVGVPRLVRVTPAGKAKRFIVRISKPVPRDSQIPQAR